MSTPLPEGIFHLSIQHTFCLLCALQAAKADENYMETTQDIRLMRQKILSQ
jgi:hypothetical protein